MYEAHFGLAQLPFRLAPDPRFYVEAAPHRAAILALREGLRRGDEFIPLLGEFGVGKTSVARRLLQEVHDDHHLTGELTGALVDADDLFDRVGEALGLGAHDEPEELIQQLEGLARSGGDAVLLVDDAHDLAPDALQRLCTLTALRVDGRPPLHVTLVGRALPAGVAAVRPGSPALDFGTPVQVEPLDVAGTREYILKRLARAGWTGRPAFEPDTTAEIHARCLGNPGLINRLCGHLLLQLFMEGRDDLSPAIVRAGDDLLRCELEGLPATDKLPPPAPRPPAASDPSTVPAPRAHEAASTAVAVDVEAGAAEASNDDAALAVAPARLPVPLRAEPDRQVVARPAAPPWRDRRSRHRAWAQGAVAAAFLVGGGLLATAMIDRKYTRAPSSVHALAQRTPPTFAPATSTATSPATMSVSVAPPPLPSTSDDAAIAAAERALAQAPPGAGPAPAPAPIRDAAAVPAVPHAADDPGARLRPHAMHKVHERPTSPAAAPATALAAPACPLESEALGLCHHGRAHAGAVAPAPIPARDTTPVVRPVPDPPTPPAPPACEPARAALGLCGPGSRPTP